MFKQYCCYCHQFKSNCAKVTDYAYYGDSVRILCNDCLKNSSHYCNICNTYHNIPLCVKVMIEPSFIFYKNNNENTNQYIGFELEFKYKKPINNIINNLYAKNQNKHFWFDYDVSVYPGFELKTHPMSFDYIINSNIIKELFVDFLEKETYIDNSCGLHFHISRDSFTKDGIKKLDWFVNTYNDFCSQYGGRNFTNNNFCRRKLKESNEWGDSWHSSHYHSVNLENNNTIEIRFCSSTNNYKEFINKLLFIKFLLTFVETDCVFNKFYNEDNLNNIFRDFLKIYNF